MRAIEDHRVLRDANGRLLAALGGVSGRCSIADRVAVLEHRLGQPGVREGYDPVGLDYAVVAAAAALAEAVEVALAEPAGTTKVPRRAA